MRAYAALHPAADHPREATSPVAARLNDALATKLVSVLRSRRHHFLSKRFDSKDVAEMFLDHSKTEQDHADLIAERIVQLGEEPQFSPEVLASPVHAPFGQPSANLEDMALEDLDATQSGMQAMRDFVRFIGSRDTVTRRLLRAILESDQGRAEELATVAGPLPQARSAGAQAR
jgi:bacterioferritin